MYLLAATSIFLFSFFQLNPMFQGPVGVALEISLALLGAIGLLSCARDYAHAHATSFLNGPAMRNQLAQFVGIHPLLKVFLLLVAITLPMLAKTAFGT